MTLVYYCKLTLIPLCAIWLLQLSAGDPFAAEDDGEHPGQKYQLTEEWSVDAQGPVHLRQKSVKAVYQLEVTDLGLNADSLRQLQIHFVDVSVSAEISAQKRKGSFDSSNPPEKLTIENLELIRPIALLNQKLVLKYDDQGVLKGVAGTEAVTRRLDELYNAHLRGSEQDLYTRDFEREQISEAELMIAWRNVFLVPQPLESAAEPAPEAAPDLRCVACIPSESWMRRVELPVNETTQKRVNVDGTTTIEQQAGLKEAQEVQTSIGDTAWKYKPVKAERTTTVKIGASGRVEEMKRSATAELATVLSLGNDVPIQMTISHVTELKKP